MGGLSTAAILSKKDQKGIGAGTVLYGIQRNILSIMKKRKFMDWITVLPDLDNLF